MGDAAEEAEDAYWASMEVSESMENQFALEAKIEAFAQIDEDVKNGKTPF